MDEHSSDPLVRVAVVGDAMTARIRAALLESMGMQPHLRGEGFGPYPVTVGRLAEVEIWVREADAEDARSALEEGHEGSMPDHMPDGRDARPSVSPAVAAAVAVVLGLAVVLTAMRLF
jgi:hypothetical protein